MIDWLDDRWPVVFLAVALVLTSLLVRLCMSAADDAERARAAFMSDCQAHGRAEYECTALWRAGEKHTEVVSVPVVVGR